MPTINKDDMTITIVCQSEDEAGARVELQELLEANPGYKPVLTVEDPVGNEITHTSLSAPVEDEVVVVAEVAEPIEEPAEVVAEEPATEEEAVEDTSDEESTDEEATEEEA
jgi:hypothetical protein